MNKNPAKSNYLVQSGMFINALTTKASETLENTWTIEDKNMLTTA